MLVVDSFPGFICGDHKVIDGVKLRSSHSSLYSDSLCVIRFLSERRPSSYTSKRLMLNFEKFEISDRSVELTILGTSRTSDVRSCHWFRFINQLSFGIVKFQLQFIFYC